MVTIEIYTHPTATGARSLGQGSDRWALVDDDGNTVDVVNSEEVVRLIVEEGD